MSITEGSLAQYLNRIYELLDLRAWGNSRVRLARWVWDHLADRTPAAAGSD